MPILFYRLLLSVVVAMSVAFCGALILSVSAMRSSSEAQLLARSEGAALLLSMTLAQPDNNTLVAQKLLIEAVFDTGHYSKVRLDDPQGRPLIERILEHDTGAAPDWFQSIVAIKPETISRPVADGWRQIGTINLVANDGYVLTELWESCTDLIGLMLAVTVLWALSVYWLTRWRDSLHS